MPKYSAKFINEVKRLYPNFIEMHTLADNGGVLLGRYICDSIPAGISFQTVIAADSLEELQKLAVEGVAKERLYYDWNREYNSSLK